MEGFTVAGRGVDANCASPGGGARALVAESLNASYAPVSRYFFGLCISVESRAPDVHERVWGGFNERRGRRFTSALVSSHENASGRDSARSGFDEVKKGEIAVLPPNPPIESGRRVTWSTNSEVEIAQNGINPRSANEKNRRQPTNVQTCQRRHSPSPIAAPQQVCSR